LGVLLIVSAEEKAGKTALCAGLAINFVNDGRKTGYIKLHAPETAGQDGDYTFMMQIPGMSEGVNGKDIVLAEGSTGAGAHDEASKSAFKAAREMKARVIAVEVYSAECPRFADVYKGFGASLLGMIINKAPQSQLKRIREEAGARCAAEGIKLLGVIPENRVLLAITVGELAESLGGKILNNAEKSTELVENYMVGAMVVGSGLDYFGRKSRKAAIVHHDRPDMQLAALETPTACLVLSGSPDKSKPMYNVLYKARGRGIPVIVTGAAIPDIVSTIEETLLKTRLGQPKKLTGLAEAVRKNIDIKALA
jgi:hypothetical protein